MRYVVTTPTGNVGAHVVRLLLQAGVRPSVLVRDPGRLAPEVRAAVDAVACDQGDTDAVLRATEGADALYWVDPPADDPDPLAVYERMGDSVARAVTEHGIPRVVFQSSVGAEKRSGAGEIDGLASTELKLDATEASVTHLRCGFFFTNLLLDPGLEKGVLRTVLPLDHPLPWVDPRDIGDVAAARLLAGGWSGRHVQAVHGPAHFGFAEAARIVSEATGREVRAERVADEDMRSALEAAGLADKQVEAILGMSVGLRVDFEPEQERTVLTTTPTTLRSWAAEHLRVSSRT